MAAEYSLANGMEPIRGFFFLEEPGSARRNASIIGSFLAAIEDASVRLMEIDTSSAAASHGSAVGKLKGGSELIRNTYVV